jgi:hypothetical protein
MKTSNLKFTKDTNDEMWKTISKSILSMKIPHDMNLYSQFFGKYFEPKDKSNGISIYVTKNPGLKRDKKDRKDKKVHYDKSHDTPKSTSSSGRSKTSQETPNPSISEIDE